MPNELKSLRQGCQWSQAPSFILGSVAVLQQGGHLTTVRYRNGQARPAPCAARSQWRPERINLGIMPSSHLPAGRGTRYCAWALMR